MSNNSVLKEYWDNTKDNSVIRTPRVMVQNPDNKASLYNWNPSVESSDYWYNLTNGAGIPDGISYSNLPTDVALSGTHENYTNQDVNSWLSNEDNQKNLREYGAGWLVQEAQKRGISTDELAKLNFTNQGEGIFSDGDSLNLSDASLAHGWKSLDSSVIDTLDGKELGWVEGDKYGYDHGDGGQIKDEDIIDFFSDEENQKMWNSLTGEQKVSFASTYGVPISIVNSLLQTNQTNQSNQDLPNHTGPIYTGNSETTDVDIDDTGDINTTDTGDVEDTFDYSFDNKNIIAGVNDVVDDLGLGYGEDYKSSFDDNLGDAISNITKATADAQSNIDDYSYNPEQTESYEDVLARTMDPNNPLLKRAAYLASSQSKGFMGTAASDLATRAMLDKSMEIAAAEIETQQENVSEANKALSDIFGKKADITKTTFNSIASAIKQNQLDGNSTKAQELSDIFALKTSLITEEYALGKFTEQEKNDLMIALEQLGLDREKVDNAFYIDKEGLKLDWDTLEWNKSLDKDRLSFDKEKLVAEIGKADADRLTKVETTAYEIFNNTKTRILENPELGAEEKDQWIKDSWSHYVGLVKVQAELSGLESYAGSSGNF